MFTSRSTQRLSFLVVALALVATACGGGGAATPDENGNITIELSDFAFSPEDVTVKVGDTVTVKLTNTGAVSHEWMLGREAETEDGSTSGFHENFFDDVEGIQVMPMDAAQGMEGMEGMEGDHGFMILRGPSEEASVTFTVTADKVGEWEMGCFVDGGAHWDAGMKGKFTVES